MLAFAKSGLSMGVVLLGGLIDLLKFVLVLGALVYVVLPSFFDWRPKQGKQKTSKRLRLRRPSRSAGRPGSQLAKQSGFHVTRSCWSSLFLA